MIPSFAVGRTQELIYELNRYYEGGNKYSKDLEDLDVYIDSPMATTATEVFKRNAQVFDEETKQYILKGDNPLDFKNLKFTRTTEESQRLNADRTPKVIISASGMSLADQVREYEKEVITRKIREAEKNGVSKDDVASELGLSRATLYRKLSELSIKKE